MDLVLSFGHLKQISSFATRQLVVTSATSQRVIATATNKCVVAAATNELITELIGHNHVWPIISFSRKLRYPAKRELVDTILSR